MSVRDRFSSDNPFVLPALLATARTNQADLQVITRETDHLKATSVAFQNQGLTNNPANPVSNVTLVAQQTIGNAVGDGELVDPRCPEINQFVLVMKSAVVAIRAKDLNVGDHLWNPITNTAEKVIFAETVPSVIYEVRGANGTVVQGSPTTPLITGTWDQKGLKLEKCTNIMRVISYLEALEYTKLIKVTKKRKKGEVRHISTEGPTHIYCAGTRADRMFLLHNAKPREDL